jgi:ATP synthase protein I
MSEGDPPTRLNDLDDRLRRLRERTPKEEEQTDEGARPPTQSAYGFAFRVGVEMVAALAVGGGIGWLLDRWLGTMPIFLLIFFLLGAVAGLLNVFRAAKELNRDV